MQSTPYYEDLESLDKLAEVILHLSTTMDANRLSAKKLQLAVNDKKLTEFCGDVGSGKTHVLMTLALEKLASGKTVLALTSGSAEAWVERFVERAREHDAKYGDPESDNLTSLLERLSVQRAAGHKAMLSYLDNVLEAIREGGEEDEPMLSDEEDKSRKTNGMFTKKLGLVVVDSLTLLISGEDSAVDDKLDKNAKAKKTFGAREKFLNQSVRRLRMLPCPVAYSAHLVGDENAVVNDETHSTLRPALGIHWLPLCDRRFLVSQRFGIGGSESVHVGEVCSDKNTVEYAFNVDVSAQFGTGMEL